MPDPVDEAEQARINAKLAKMREPALRGLAVMKRLLAEREKLARQKKPPGGDHGRS